MAKIIKLTPEVLAEVRKDFETALSGAKLADGKFNFSKSFSSSQRKATVYFTEIAWLKMQMLISEFDSEVAWHGIAKRGEDPEKDEYIISDILVYPQEVTGSTVTSDQTKYQEWLMEQEDDVFNNIRMQGHSHVNMSTSPSGVDLALYEKILDQLDDSMFYIFLIYNKRGDKTYKIYDMAKNVLFETSDVTVQIAEDGSGITKFLADAKSKVQTRKYQPPVYASGGYTRQTQPVKPATTASPAAVVQSASKPALPAAPVKKTEPEEIGKSGKKTDGRKKGKRREEVKQEKNGGYTNQYSAKDDRWDGDYYGYDDDGPYSAFGYGYLGGGRRW